MPNLALRGMSTELHGELKSAAGRNHRSLNSEIIARLTASVRDEPTDAGRSPGADTAAAREHRGDRPAGRDAAGSAERRPAVIVIDTNVMVHLLLGGEHGEDAALLFERDPEWAAPVILTSELRNVLLGYVRRGDLTADQANAMCDDAAEVLKEPHCHGRQRPGAGRCAGVRPVGIRRRIRSPGANPGQSPWSPWTARILHEAEDVAVSLRND